ncbi:MAG: hypothetical protein HFI68_02400 [Lachnospiraceae bacterium]|nr:hypothetical protein [Lachnospiraceae bacterium]
MKKNDLCVQNKSVLGGKELSWNRNALVHLMGGIRPVETSKKDDGKSDVKLER